MIVVSGEEDLLSIEVRIERDEIIEGTKGRVATR
jgi:uncharacterized protein (UPF0218 family)